MAQQERSNEVALPPPPDTVVLRQTGQFLRITPPVAGLDRWLYTVLHLRMHDAVRGACLARLADPLVAKVPGDGRPALGCGAGLKTIIQELLEWHGLRVEMRGEPAALTEPAWERLAAFKRPDYALLSFVLHQDRGLIWHEPRGKVSVARLIAQIALAWPRKRLLVVATRVPDARRLARRLRQFLPRVGLVTGRDRKDQRRRRVLVATPRYLGRGDVAAERREICVALNPAELFGLALGKGGDVLNGLWTARLYGLVATDQEFPPRVRDRLTAYFGPREVLIPRHGYQHVAVRVVFTPVRGGPRPPNHKDPALVKRLGVHEHALRNRRICRLARALAGKAHNALEADFPQVAAALGARVRRVGVLVDHVAHGLALARQLHWPLVVGPVFNDAGLADADRELLALGRDGHARTRRPVVVTGSGLKRAGTFEVLVRADGGVGMPDVPLAKLAAPDDQGRRMLLVDFRDGHHPLLRRWSRMRRTAYEEAGWPVVGRERSDLEWFLDTRPGVV
jgi:hypothetical protein